MPVLQYSFNTFLGDFKILENDGKVIFIDFPNCGITKMKKWCEKYLPAEEVIEVSIGGTNASEEINKFLYGKRRSLCFPFQLLSSPFMEKALLSVANIPYGHTKSYKDIAAEVQNPKAVRAVGNANAFNPLPLIIPCHRVISHNGSLGGYRGGLDLKMKLLELEGGKRIFS